MFDTHVLNEQGFEQMKEYKNLISYAVKEATKMMRDSREKSLFITHIEEAVFWGAKAIAQMPENYKEKITF